MEIFFTLLIKILPLYLIILLGYIAGRKFSIEKKTIASILIYFLTPVIAFGGIAVMPFAVSSILLPLVIFFIATVSSILFFTISKKIWTGSERNLSGFVAGEANTGYFGLPVALSLFGSQYLGYAILLSLGSVLYENTVGYFILSRGKHSFKDSIKRIFRLPSVYSFLVGLLFSFAGLHLSASMIDLVASFKGAYIVLGMMMIGFGLSSVKKADFDLKLLSLSFLAKFAFWPLLTIALIVTDKTFFHMYSQEIYGIITIMSIVPVASNAVAYASALDMKPEKASVLVVVSTLFALVYIPVFVILFM